MFRWFVVMLFLLMRRHRNCVILTKRYVLFALFKLCLRRIKSKLRPQRPILVGKRLR